MASVEPPDAAIWVSHEDPAALTRPAVGEAVGHRAGHAQPVLGEQRVDLSNRLDCFWGCAKALHRIHADSGS